MCIVRGGRGDEGVLLWLLDRLIVLEGVTWMEHFKLFEKCQREYPNLFHPRVLMFPEGNRNLSTDLRTPLKPWVIKCAKYNMKNVFFLWTEYTEN